MGNPWTGQYVNSSGNLRLDLLHNFFLECEARANKIRAYEMVTDPCARTMIGYLLALVKSLVQRLNERAFGCHSNVNDCAGRSPRATSEPGGCPRLVDAL